MTPVAILAGGQGRRIGGGKPLRVLGGETLLSRAVKQARQWSDEIAVVVRSVDQLGDAEATMIADRTGIDGPLAGVAAALEWASDTNAEAVLTIPTDMPFLPRDLGQRLEQARPPRQVGLASSGGHTHPVCALWPVSALRELPSFIGSGSASLRRFADHIGCVVIDWASEPFDPFFNINCPQDLAQAERLLRH